MRTFKKNGERLKVILMQETVNFYIQSPIHRKKISVSLQGHKLTEETKKKISKAHIGLTPSLETREKLSNSHKNDYDSIGYEARHCRIVKKIGRPKFCEFCKRTDKNLYDWANVSGEYKEDIKDWKRLCRKCHLRWDFKRKNKAFVNFYKYKTNKHNY